MWSFCLLGFHLIRVSVFELELKSGFPLKSVVTYTPLLDNYQQIRKYTAVITM
jgi:hypothetical protein